MAPAIRTRAEPYRSASMPAMGVAMPQIRFCMATAKEKISRGQPCASEIGTVKKPKVDLTPKLTTATRQPATIIAVTV